MTKLTYLDITVSAWCLANKLDIGIGIDGKDHASRVLRTVALFGFQEE